MNYTFSRTLGVADSDSSSVSPYFPARSRNYGPSSFNRTNVLVINYLYELPKLAGRSHFRPAHWVLDDWQLSGITRITSGFPVTLHEDGDNSLQGSSPNGVNNHYLDTPDYNGLPLQINSNPRNGLRREAGTLIIQGHDPTTDLSFRNLRAAETPPR